MRESHQPQQVHIVTGPGQTTVAALSPGGAPTNLETKIPPPYPGHTPLELSLPIAPPDASDIRKLQNVSQNIPDHKTPSGFHKHPHHGRTKLDNLQEVQKTFNIELKTTLSSIGTCSDNQHHSKRMRAQNAGGGSPKGLKRRSTATRA